MVGQRGGTALEQKYSSIKVTISPLAGERYRSRVEASGKEGSNFGPGAEFELNIEAARKFSADLTAGTVSKTDVQTFGRGLFKSVFRDSVSGKYEALRAVASDRGAKLRICLALQVPDLINVPWEFLHDGTNFLLKHGYPIIRVLDELVGAKSSFAPIRRLLIAAANPDQYDQFNAAEHITDLQSVLDDNMNVEILPAASREALLQKIRSGNFHAMYFVGHGEESEKTGSRIICETDAKAPEALDASDLAQALRDAGNLRFVYLNSCSTAKTALSNPFQGVAQRLMLDGDVAAVAAMQVDVRQKAGLTMAKAFFANLKDKYPDSPEDAMHAARAAATDAFSFGVPVLYSYLDAPDQLERNRLYTFLGADANSTYAMLLPSFYIGEPAEEGQPKIPDDGKFRYPGETFADMYAALSVFGLLAPVASPDEITVNPLRLGIPAKHTHYILFGSRSNSIVGSVQKQFSKNFQFKYGKKEWCIVDKLFEHEYRLPVPNKVTSKKYETMSDFGIIQKITSANRVYLILAGLGSRATHGCAWYLHRKWRTHLKDREKEFAVILQFPAGLDFEEALLINRKTAKPES
jgi:CHAT domain